MAVNIKKDFNNARSRKPDLTTLVYGKVPPQAPELEEAVLGAIMLEKDKLEDVFTILKSEDCFYVDAHQKIYAAIRRLFDKGMPVDLLTVTEELRKTSDLELVGGAYYLTKLTMSVVSSAHVEAHARLVMEKYIQREMIRISGQIINDGYEDSTDVFELLDKAQQEFYELNNQSSSKEVRHVSGAVMEVMLDAEEKKELKSEFTGVPTGSHDMDACTGGWQKSDLIILAARPAVGKTAYALTLAYNAATAPTPQPVAFFSLEMKTTQLVQRLLSAASGVAYEKIKFPNRQTEDDAKRIAETASKVGQLPMYFDDTAGLNINELRTKARRLKQKNGIQLIVIDYLQLMTADLQNSRFRELEISMITRKMKELAKELDIPIIALCQINRAVEARAIRTYKLSDLRESGAIEQDADMVMFLHVPSQEELKNKEVTILHTAGVFIEKHRSGECKKIPYIFDKTIQKWSEFGSNSFNFFNSGNSNSHPDAYHTSKSNLNNDEDLPF